MKTTESAGGVVVNSRGEILVVNQNGNSWSFPKGHIDDGEDALSAAKREIYEESGVQDVGLIRELGIYQRHKIGLDGGDDTSEFKQITMFLFSTNHEGSLTPLDKHNPEACFVEKEKVVNLLTHDKDKEFFLSVKDSI